MSLHKRREAATPIRDQQRRTLNQLMRWCRDLHTSIVRARCSHKMSTLWPYVYHLRRPSSADDSSEAYQHIGCGQATRRPW